MSKLCKNNPGRRYFSFYSAAKRRKTYRSIFLPFSTWLAMRFTNSIIDYDDPSVKLCDHWSVRIQSVWSPMNLQITFGLWVYRILTHFLSGLMWQWRSIRWDQIAATGWNAFCISARYRHAGSHRIPLDPSGYNITPGLTFKNSKFCPHSIFMSCMDLETNSDNLHTQY